MIGVFKWDWMHFYQNSLVSMWFHCTWTIRVCRRSCPEQGCSQTTAPPSSAGTAPVRVFRGVQIKKAETPVWVWSGHVNHCWNYRIWVNEVSDKGDLTVWSVGAPDAGNDCHLTLWFRMLNNCFVLKLYYIILHYSKEILKEYYWKPHDCLWQTQQLGPNRPININNHH